MNKLISFFSILAVTTFFFSATHAVKITIEADLETVHTSKIRQQHPGDTSTYWTQNAGRHSVSWESDNGKSFYPNFKEKYDYDTHRVTLEGNLEDLLKGYPSRLVSFVISTVVYDVGKSEYNPRYSYDFGFILPEINSDSSEKTLKITVHPSKIMHTAAHTGGCWHPTEYQLKYVPPSPTFKVEIN